MASRSPPRLWPLYAVNFFMADMQSGIGPFVGVFLQERLGDRTDRHRADDRQCRRHAGHNADRRLHEFEPQQAPVGHHSRHLRGACVRDHPDLATFWAVTLSQVAQSLASAAIVPAVTGITLGIARQKGFNALNGRNQAFNHAGNMVGAALSGYLGYKFGYVAVFVLAAVFGAIAIACVLMIPDNSIDDRQARGSKEDESKNPPDGMSVLLKHKPLLVLAFALAIFHLGNAAIVPLYGLAAVAEGQANGPSFVATTVVIAQGVMVVTSLIAMQVAGKRNYWPVILISFMFLPIRGMLAFFVTGWWGVIPTQVLDGIGTGLQTVAVPGMVARSLDGTGRINLGQGAVITVQGVGASLSPALGGWIAQWIGYGPTFLLLGGFGLASIGLWLAFGAAVKKY